MLKKIGSIDKIQAFLDTVKQTSRSAAKESGQSVTVKPTRLMGFGHRIYKTTDPRSRLCKQLTLEVCKTNTVV